MTGAKWSGQHRRLSEKLRARAIGQFCHFCGRPMLPGQALDLDHAPDGRRYRGVAHSSCNRSAGGRQGKLIQLAYRGQRRRRFIMGNEVAFGIEIAVDRTHTSIARAGRGRDGRVVVELAAYLEGTNHAGTVHDMVATQGKPKVLAVLLDPRSPAATLVEPLKALRVDITEASPHVVAAAHGSFADELRAGRLAIVKHPVLDAAAQHAATRQVAGAEALDRRKPTVDVSAIVAAELATWAALNVKRGTPEIHVWRGSSEAAVQ
jgi:hypothetical protein